MNHINEIPRDKARQWLIDHGFIQADREIRKHKYNATRVEIDGIKFPSKKEATKYHELDVMRQAGAIKYFLCQVPFYLPGGVKYLCDFQIFENDGRVRYIDTKGFKTDTYKLKKRQVEALYPVIIEEE